jgi:hypothetical protein
LLSGQELVLTKNKSGKEKIIKQGKKIKVWTNAGVVYKGFFSLKNDSIVFPGEGIIAIKDIKMIAKKTTGVKIAGGSLTGIGGITTIGLGIATIQMLAEGGFATLGLIFVVPLEAISVGVTITGVTILKNGRRFKKKKWDYSIRNNERGN